MNLGFQLSPVGIAVVSVHGAMAEQDVRANATSPRSSADRPRRSRAPTRSPTSPTRTTSRYRPMRWRTTWPATSRCSPPRCASCGPDGETVSVEPTDGGSCATPPGHRCPSSPPRPQQYRRPQARRGTAALPRRPRPAGRDRQPAPLGVRPRPRARSGRTGGAADPRPRRLQARQRHVRPGDHWRCLIRPRHRRITGACAATPTSSGGSVATSSPCSCGASRRRGLSPSLRAAVPLKPCRSTRRRRVGAITVSVGLALRPRRAPPSTRTTSCTSSTSPCMRPRRRAATASCPPGARDDPAAPAPG